MNHYQRISVLLLAFAALPQPPVLSALPLPQDAKKPCTVQNQNSESLRKESELGQQLAKEVERSSRILNDSAATEYVNRLAQNLARNSDARFPIRVKIIDSAVRNELILPGGLLYIDDGLVLQAETESELVGALAYGIAYTTLRCGTPQATPGQLTQLGSMVSLPYSWVGYGIYEGMNLAIPLAYLKEQREFVLTADSVGLKYLYETGYNPEDSLRLLERISPQTARVKNAQNTFSTFPSLALRLERMRKEIATVFPWRDEAIISSSEFEKFKERLSVRKTTDSQPMPRPTLRKRTAP